MQQPWSRHCGRECCCQVGKVSTHHSWSPDAEPTLIGSHCLTFSSGLQPSFQLSTWGDCSSCQIFHLCYSCCFSLCCPSSLPRTQPLLGTCACGKWDPPSFSCLCLNLKLLLQACPFYLVPHSHLSLPCPCSHPIPVVLLLYPPSPLEPPARQGPVAPPSSPGPGGLSAQHSLGVCSLGRFPCSCLGHQHQ